MLSIIVPTLGTRLVELRQLLDSLEKQTFKQFETIIAIQGNHDEVAQVAAEFKLDIKICNLNKRGLSYARNKAIDLISESCSLVTFSDDDCWYPENAFEIVSSRMKGGKDCRCYQIYDPTINEYYKNYPKEPNQSFSYREILGVSSIEIFIPKFIIDSGVRFDERFGLGTPYPSGEENIFLFDIVKKQYTVSYSPEIIVYHLKPNWASKEYIFKGKGALFSRLYNRPLALIMIIIYSLKKYKFSSDLFQDMKRMFLEVLNYKNK